MKHLDLAPLARLARLAPAELTRVTGGMQWQNFRASYNVEDRRPGAGTPSQQRQRTDAWNAERGYPVWADLHPKQR
jgi:hypothetical protein